MAAKTKLLDQQLEDPAAILKAVHQQKLAPNQTRKKKFQYKPPLPGGVNLPNGGSASTNPASQFRARTDNPVTSKTHGGGAVTLPDSAVTPGILKLIETGRGSLDTPYAQQDYEPTSGTRKGGARTTIDMMPGLTNEEAQLIQIETAKGSIARQSRGDDKGVVSRFNLPDGMSHSQYNALGMFERLALQRGTLDASNKAVAEGRAKMSDLLATGERRSRYDDLGTVREEVSDQRMVQGPYARGVEDRTRIRSRDRTEQEFVDDFNAPNIKLREESQAIQTALKADRREHRQESELERITADASVAEARIKSEANIRTAEFNAKGRLPAFDSSRADYLFNIMGRENYDQEKVNANIHRLKQTISKAEKNTRSDDGYVESMKNLLRGWQTKYQAAEEYYGMLEPGGNEQVQTAKPSPEEQEALEWLQANPNDPEAGGVRARLASAGHLQQ